MKNRYKLLSLLLIFTLLFANSLVISFAADDIVKTHFMVFLKESYCSRVQEVIDSIDCEYIGEVRELTNPDDYIGEEYTPMLLVCVKDKNEAYFDKAQEYFFDKDYYYKTTYDILLGNGDTWLCRTQFIVIIKEEYVPELDAITESIDCKYIENVMEAEYFLPSSDPRAALCVFTANGDEAFFGPAQEYFSHKEYVDVIEYDYLVRIGDFLHGDADGDGKYTAGDARFILRCAVGLEQYNSLIQCDANADGAVNAEDARLVLRFAVGLPA